MTDFERRRSFLKRSAGFLAALAAVRGSSGDEAQVNKQTFTYKTVGKCAIKLDVYGTGDGAVRPAVIWIHGGALIMGNRGQIGEHFRDSLIKAGLAVVSVDYRLAPETKLPAILDDIRDAYRWVRENGAKTLAIDPARIAVAGASAGGYLTLTTGYRVEPRPKALVSFWGYGDIAGPWYSRPDEFYRTQPLVPEETARKAVGKIIISESSGRDDRRSFYLYCRQQGLWPREVAGLDPEKNPRALDPFCPDRNVDDMFPPTLLIHGTKDTDVPYALSEAMAGALSRRGVASELVTIPDAGHGLSGAKPELVTQVYDGAVDFLRESLR